MQKTKLAQLTDLEPLTPSHALLANVDLVVVRWDEGGEDHVSVLYGRCKHRGALLADGFIDGDNLICGVHNWDYPLQVRGQRVQQQRAASTASTLVGRKKRRLRRRGRDRGLGDASTPSRSRREEYQGNYADVHGTVVEPHVSVHPRSWHRRRPVEDRSSRSAT